MKKRKDDKKLGTAIAESGLAPKREVSGDRSRDRVKGWRSSTGGCDEAVERAREKEDAAGKEEGRERERREKKGGRERGREQEKE